MIRKMYRKGVTDVWYCTEGTQFVGLAITINSPDRILLDYFAIAEDLRGSGYGSAILRGVIRQYEGKGLFGEIESTYEDCPDRELRQRRKAFYLRNGLRELGVMVELFGVTMELLGVGCTMDYAEYRSFYADNYSRWAAEHIAPAVHPDFPN